MVFGAKLLAHHAFGIVKQHTAILPLVGAFSFAGAMGIFMASYTATRKSDVTWNRWKTYVPSQSVDWTKGTQKLFVVVPDEKTIFQDDPPLKTLLDEIYRDGGYKN